MFPTGKRTWSKGCDPRGVVPDTPFVLPTYPRLEPPLHIGYFIESYFVMLMSTVTLVLQILHYFYG